MVAVRQKLHLRLVRNRYNSRAVQTGAALLAILAVVIVAFTLVLTATISINSIRHNASLATRDVLMQARVALEGYALRQATIGRLPCPDVNGDGQADMSGSECTSQRGQLPYITLQLPRLLDGSGAELWYAVEASYASTVGTKNPSSLIGLSVDGTAAAAVLIAPGKELGTQVRNNPVTVTKYLEGENANGNVTVYSSLFDQSHNDHVLPLKKDHYWSLIQRATVHQMVDLLSRYQAACGVLPWAADFGTAPFNSVDLQTEGAFPFHSALPTNWNAGCAAGLAPSSEWASHWGTEIYYALCDSSTPDCLSIVGDLTASVDAVVIAPGVALPTQARPSMSLSNYFELNNAVLGSPYEYRKPLNFDGSFNDVLQTVEF